MSSLLSLPVELLHRIASFLPYSAFVQLQCVNRHLHAACNDHLLRRNVTLNTFANTPGAVEQLLTRFPGQNVRLSSEALEWPQGASLLATVSPAEVTRMAQAAQRLTDCAVSSGDDRESWTLRADQNQKFFDASMWLPQLLALHHPAALNLGSHTFLTMYLRISDRRYDIHPSMQTARDAEFASVHFILCYLILQELCTTDQSSFCVVQAFQRKFFPNQTLENSPQLSYDDMKLIDGIIERINDGVPQGDPASLTREEATSILLPMLLRHAEQFRSQDSSGLLPRPRQILFNTFMDIQPIYENFAESFNKCHIRGMTNTDFIAGNWLGIYSDHRGLQRSMASRPRIDPPMSNIRLVTRTPAEDDNESHRHADGAIGVVIDRSSRGVDAHGEFTLEGRILKTGEVSMVKRYIVHGWNWNWTGFVTPFGLVGVWGSAAYMGGWFWIWKEEWATNQ